MNDPNIILALDKDGNEITAQNVNEWLLARNKLKLSDFFYDRFHGRYLKPFDYCDEKYIREYKSGFAIMTSCCLLY